MEYVFEEILIMDKPNDRANEKLNFLSDDEEVRRMVELRKKGEADRIAQEELAVERAVEKRRLEIAKKMLEKDYPLHDISEITDFSINKLSNGDVIIFKTNIPESEMRKLPIFPNQHEFYTQLKKIDYQLEICLIIKNFKDL